MKIKKLFNSANYPAHMVAETIDGKFVKFLATPFRQVQEKDFFPLPYYQAKGKNADEAPDYVYKSYGLEKIKTKAIVKKMRLLFLFAVNRRQIPYSIDTVFFGIILFYFLFVLTVRKI